MSSPFFRATATLVGTIIGAGIFGIPYVTAQSGYLVGLIWLIGLTILTIIIKLAYVQVILRDSKHRHQLTGYGKHYFGEKGKWIATFILVIGQWGAIVAYIIGIGEFLATFVGRPELAFVASVVAFAVGSAVILFGLKVVSSVESIITLLMVGMVGALGTLGLNKIEPTNLITNYQLPITGYLLPYGIVFGALSGWAVIPEVARILNPSGLKWRRKGLDRVLSRVVVVGVLVPAVVYAIFQFAVVGISGMGTSEEAIAGLVPYFSPAIIKAGALFGVMAMGTSFLALSYALKDMFELDFKLQPMTSWFLTLFPPFFIFLLGLRSFIAAFEFTGAWIGTLSMILIFALFIKSRE